MEPDEGQSCYQLGVEKDRNQDEGGRHVFDLNAASDELNEIPAQPILGPVKPGDEDWSRIFAENVVSG